MEGVPALAGGGGLEIISFSVIPASAFFASAAAESWQESGYNTFAELVVLKIR